MALSNWDLLSIDENHKSTNGSISLDDGKTDVEIYKNYVHIKSGEASLTMGTGHITMGGNEIFAKSGPQNSVFCLVMSPPWAEDDVTIKLMAGIGCYGYADDGEFVGVLPETYEEFLQWLESLKEDMYGEDYGKWIEVLRKSSDTITRVNQGDKFFTGEELATPVGRCEATTLLQRMLTD